VPRGPTLLGHDADDSAAALSDSDHPAAPFRADNREPGAPPAARRFKSTTPAAETPEVGPILLASLVPILGKKTDIHIVVEESVLKAAKIRCIQEDLVLSDVITQLLREWVADKAKTNKG